MKRSILIKLNLTAISSTLLFAVNANAQDANTPIITDEQCAQIMSEFGGLESPENTLGNPPAPGSPSNPSAGGGAIGGAPVTGSAGSTGSAAGAAGTAGVAGGTAGAANTTNTGGSSGSNSRVQTNNTASSTASANGNEGKYLTNPNINILSRTFRRSDASDNVNNVVIFFRAPNNSAFQQNVAKDKPYRPGPRPIRTVKGQSISVKSNEVRIGNLSQGIVNAFDEIHLVSKALGFPPPIVTSGNDSNHTAGSAHFSNNAIDIRCNGANEMTPTKCKQQVIALKAALGPKYDVIFEDYGNANNHIHISFKG